MNNANGGVQALENEENVIGKILTFKNSGEIYGFDIRSVLDIIEFSDITRLPMVADCICGIMNLRGRAVPVMDLLKRLGTVQAEYDKHSSIIVVECDGSQLGIKTERVIDAEIYSRDDVIKNPVENSCIYGYIELNGRRITVINCEKLADIS